MMSAWRSRCQARNARISARTSFSSVLVAAWKMLIIEPRATKLGSSGRSTWRRARNRTLCKVCIMLPVEIGVEHPHFSDLGHRQAGLARDPPDRLRVRAVIDAEGFLVVVGADVGMHPGDA